MEDESRFASRRVLDEEMSESKDRYGGSTLMLRGASRVGHGDANQSIVKLRTPQRFARCSWLRDIAYAILMLPAEYISRPYLVKQSRDGGTGRRSGLKIRRASALGGSIPPPGTNLFTQCHPQFSALTLGAPAPEHLPDGCRHVLLSCAVRSAEVIPLLINHVDAMTCIPPDPVTHP